MAWPKEVPVKRYPSDLTDEEWQLLEPLLEAAEPYTTGRPRTHELREMINAIFYLNKTGCPWRYLPKDFPSYKLVSYYYHKWVDNQCRSAHLLNRQNSVSMFVSYWMK